MRKYFFSVLRHKYLCPSGRATRKEFWLFTLWCAVLAVPFGVVIYLPACFVTGWLAKAGAIAWADHGLATSSIMAWGYLLALAPPYFSAMARRLHDIGLSGLWGWLYFIPFLGPLAIWVLCAMPTKEGPQGEGLGKVTHGAD